MTSTATPSVLPYMPTPPTIVTWYRLSPSVLLYLPTPPTIVTWYRLHHRVFYFICLYLEPLLRGIVSNTECFTLPAYITDHCYVASTATPSVLPYMPILQIIVTWHRLQHRVFYLTCLNHRPLLHDIVCSTECSTLPAYITDQCYMASSVTRSVILYLPTSRTIVTWHCLKHRVFYCTCLYHGPLLHDMVCNTECPTLSAYLTDHCYMASSAAPSVLPYLPISQTIVTWHRLQH